MFRSRSTTTTSKTSLAKAARELERQIMTMEVVSGEDSDAAAAAEPASSPQEVRLPDRLVFGPYGIAPLTGLHFDSENDTATS